MWKYFINKSLRPYVFGQSGTMNDERYLYHTILAKTTLQLIYYFKVQIVLFVAPNNIL